MYFKYSISITCIELLQHWVLYNLSYYHYHYYHHY